MKFGVVRFPGLLRRASTRCCAASTRRRRRAALARRPRPAGRRRGRRPRRLLLRRLPARRRDRALLAGHGAVERFAARRRAGARHLQRLPGAVRGRAAARRAAAEHVAALRLPPGRRSRSSTRDTPFTRACEPGERLSIPAKHTTGRYYAPDPGSTSSRPTARSCCATRRRQPQRLGARHRGRRRNERRQRRRADAAPRARGRPADRLGRRAEAVRVAPPRGRRLTRRRAPTRELGLTDAEYDADRRASSAASPTRSSSRCSR